MQSVTKRSGGNIQLKDGTLYPILYRLEDNKYIESYWFTDDESRSKPRKFYKITDAGIIRYQTMLADYLEINNGIKEILSSERGE